MDLTVSELELLFTTELTKRLQCLRCLDKNSGKKCRLTKGGNCTLCKKHKVKCSLMPVKADGQPDRSKRSNDAWLKHWMSATAKARATHELEVAKAEARAGPSGQVQSESPSSTLGQLHELTLQGGPPATDASAADTAGAPHSPANSPSATSPRPVAERPSPAAPSSSVPKDTARAGSHKAGSSSRRATFVVEITDLPPKQRPQARAAHRRRVHSPESPSLVEPEQDMESRMAEFERWRVEMTEWANEMNKWRSEMFET